MIILSIHGEWLIDVKCSVLYRTVILSLINIILLMLGEQLIGIKFSVMDCTVLRTIRIMRV